MKDRVPPASAAVASATEIVGSASSLKIEPTAEPSVTATVELPNARENTSSASFKVSLVMGTTTVAVVCPDRKLIVPAVAV